MQTCPCANGPPRENPVARLNPPTVRREIEIFGDWVELGGPTRMGTLFATTVRAQETYEFHYDTDWLSRGLGHDLDPQLHFFGGPQYPGQDKANFGLFLDSSPDRWGRFLMNRREAQRAREEQRPARKLRESDYLLGVFDEHRMGALRFRLAGQDEFQDHQQDLTSPPWARLRELEEASLQLEQGDAEEQPEYKRWLTMLIAPGGSLGGARPKAGVLDPQNHLWIAKFPSRGDGRDVGGWEFLVHRLAERAGIWVSEAQRRRFNSQHHTFLSKRFDRTQEGHRVHFASALTLLGAQDGYDASQGASYLELAEILVKQGGHTDRDLEQLWRRIVFNVCVSNVDDHLRNHGFLLGPAGWELSPAYDMNPDPMGDGLRLNLSEAENEQSLDLTLEVAPYFRLRSERARAVLAEVVAAVHQWRNEAQSLGFTRAEIEELAMAFRISDQHTEA